MLLIDFLELTDTHESVKLGGQGVLLGHIRNQGTLGVGIPIRTHIDKLTAMPGHKR